MRILIVCVAVLALAACGGPPASPGVPRLSGTPGRPAGGTGPERKAALHAAAECVRQHGIPTYQDPVLTADGHVYTDSRSYRAAEDATIAAVEQACGALMTAAQFQPTEQAPAPPALVQAGVRAAQCMRAHGLPDVSDPTAATEFTPGHGFGMNPDELPGDKENPVVQRALTECRTVLDEAARVSSLGNLGHA
ncbi:hypothetical protein Daura_14100 [Dactylosporangium aurantiacum]|uniref:Lipoprotein n=1 Tax=Dactylosporangium aurantiacum TaxID=35754 RepID=A0A9Q9IJB4_9ACTN|nr:hypothetical protein [Dactylosporangium aurantiacum]MDG6108524.1 hypothetical protein [Dactylosporangium aurantiacum]UWZ57194.1 hypothetical protein Daura_14100 [Dactylosporangium aurantiacum]